jgi:F-type H+-transporting ATPase subunit epsilon
VETAERADLIDKERAKKARETAEAKISKLSKEDAEYEMNRAALTRAITRISVADKHA